MNGSIAVPFSELFADTVRAHGWTWAYRYYVEKHGMAEWEWKLWVNVWHHANYRK